MENCNLCHKEIGEHEITYHFARNDGTVPVYHQLCFLETKQGQQGYRPEKVTVAGMVVILRTL